MNASKTPLRALCAIASLAFPFALCADVRLPAIISDNMVLQAGAPVKIWGWADPGETVTVGFAGQSVKSVAGSDGRWLVKLAPLSESSGDATLTASGKNKIEVKNVIVGEVWLASGQSNMEFRVKELRNAKDEISKANYPSIRCFATKKNISSFELDDCEGEWAVCSPDSAKELSAVAYFFAKNLHEKCKFPVGIVNSSWGGSCIQAWTPAGALKENPGFAAAVALQPESCVDLATYEKRKAEEFDKVAWKDPGLSQEASGWMKPEIDVADWEKVQMPRDSKALFGKDFNGAFWLRREVDVSDEQAGKSLSLCFGPTTCALSVWFNGERVLSSKANPDTSYPSVVVSGKLLKPGKNILAVRYFNPLGRGGALSENLSLFRMTGFDGKDLPFAGEWLGKIELSLLPAKAPGNLPPAKDFPSGPYAAMVAPLRNFTFKGALWYQGESNACDPRYRKMMEVLISSWRKNFDNPSLPFFFVQLANYMQRHPAPVESDWARCRDLQRQVLATPGSAMAVAIDIGDSKDIHPKNKQEVGRRLSLLARSLVYGEGDLECSGPVLETAVSSGGEMLLTFSHAKGGLAARDGGSPKGFSLSEDGKRYFWAKAVVDGDALKLSSSYVKTPKFVRYAWDDDPDCDLCNKDGLPASPFQAQAQ